MQNSLKSVILRVIRIFITDLLLAGIILVCFAFFHHVQPAMKSKASKPTPAPVVTEAPKLQLSEKIEEIVEVEEETVKRTPWQEKFADKFSDEIIISENSYKSPNVSIEVETVSIGTGLDTITYHVADVYIASIDNFATYTAHNDVVYFDTQDVGEMDLAANALLSMSGDFITYQQTGLLVRNDVVYKTDDVHSDICVMFRDGSIETYRRDEYNKEEILAREPYQIWNFGPELIDENGGVPTRFTASQFVKYYNPRSALGYYEPGHYCFVVVDGRSEGYSKGMIFPELSQLFVDLGCTAAYNMDGGGSAMMFFNHERVNRASNGGDRDLGDILVIRETEAAE